MNQTTHRRAWLALVAVALFALFLSACSNEENKNTAAPASTNTAPGASQPAVSNQLHTVVLETTMGKITIELLDKDAPTTADNFRQLAASGFYNGLGFHRTIAGFMIQGGDPNGNGTGGRTFNGKTLPNEINRTSPLYQDGYHRGDVAMANRGTPDTATSQFFIMHQNRGLTQLPANYTVFGRVTSGMEVVDKIATAPTEPGSDRPATVVKMTKVTVQ